MRRGETVRIVLIEIRGSGPLFLAELPRDPEPVESRGASSWFASKAVAMRGAIDRADGLWGRTIGRAWRGLQRLVAPDEYLLRGLRAAPGLTVEHPSVWDIGAVEMAWRAYLARKLRKHRTWFAIDASLTLPAALLFWLPGPNIFGYWFLYRAVMHRLAFLGTRHALQGKLATSLLARADLDEPLVPGDHERVARMAEALEFPDLAILLRRVAPDRFPE